MAWPPHSPPRRWTNHRRRRTDPAKPFPRACHPERYSAKDLADATVVPDASEYLSMTKSKTIVVLMLAALVASASADELHVAYYPYEKKLRAQVAFAEAPSQDSVSARVVVTK